MMRVAWFLKPTMIKLIFLFEWALFIVIKLLRRELGDGHKILVASYPLALFYLAACGFDAWRQGNQRLVTGWRLITLAIGLAVVDQFSKALILTLVPYETSIPIIKNWLHLGHEHNVRGSWIVGAFDLGFVNLTALMVLALLTILGSMVGYRYYTSTQRQSLWADIAFLGLFAGSVSWIYDLVFRGYVLDFISLPGIVTADLKDILAAVGVAALVAEALDNPKISFRWQGWRREFMALLQLGDNVARFSMDELRKLGQIFRGWEEH